MWHETGQIFNKANGFAEPTSGAVILANCSGGAGPWVPIDAPVHIRIRSATTAPTTARR